MIAQLDPLVWLVSTRALTQHSDAQRGCPRHHCPNRSCCNTNTIIRVDKCASRLGIHQFLPGTTSLLPYSPDHESDAIQCFATCAHCAHSTFPHHTLNIPNHNAGTCKSILGLKYPYKMTTADKDDNPPCVKDSCQRVEPHVTILRRLSLLHTYVIRSWG
jgi:hypothetical protein